jgi:hypothetical protein
VCCSKRLRRNGHQLKGELQTAHTVMREEEEGITRCEEEEEGLIGVFKRLRQLIKGSCKLFNTDCHSWEAQPPK